MERVSINREINNEKFNIFNQSDKEEDHYVNMELEKPLRSSVKKSNRPSSVDSS